MTKTSNKIIVTLIALLAVILAAFGVVLSPISSASADASTPAPIKANVSTAASVIGGNEFYEETATVNGETFTAYCWQGGGFVELFTLDKAYDVTEIFNSPTGALTFYLYIGSEASLERHNELSGDWLVDVSSSETFDDAHKYSFKINDAFKTCAVGWNKVELPFYAAVQKIGFDAGTIRYIRLNCNGCTLTAATDCDFKFGNFTFEVVEKRIVKAEPIEEDAKKTLGEWVDGIGQSVSAWINKNVGISISGGIIVIIFVVIIIAAVTRKRR